MSARVCLVALFLLVMMMGAATAVAEDLVQLNLSSGFNVDAWCGPKEQQQCYIDGTHDLIELFGNLEDGNGNYILDGSYFILAGSSAGGFGETYSIPSNGFHPLYVTGTEGSPEDGVLTGADRAYHVASTLGNDTLAGDWTEVADPSSYDLKPNCLVVGSKHSTATWQIASATVELPSAQKGKYADVNFALCALDQTDRARNIRIVALYGASGADEEVICNFSTADGGSGPLMTDPTAPEGFAVIYTMSKGLATTTGATGAILSKTSSFFEFDAPLELDDTKDLWGFRIEDVNPSLNWNGRGLVIFAATATEGVPNSPPVADAGSDQDVEDSDFSGSQVVTLDGSGSSDADGTIVSYVWKEGAAQIATGQTASVALDVGDHTMTLIVTDDDDATASDTVLVKVYAPSTPVPLNLTGGFNMDSICGPKEYQVCRTDGAHHLYDLFGELPDANGKYVRSQDSMLIADSSGEAYACSIVGMPGHPINYSGTEALPADGVLTGAGDRTYHMASVGGNALLPGDWTEVADPSSYDLKCNSMVVGSKHDTATWQIASATVELPSAQKGKYADVNFVLAAMNVADRARNMRIVALYGENGSDEEEIYAFSTADGGNGPKLTDTTAPSGFAGVYTMSKCYSSSSGVTGSIYAATSSLWEFDAPIDLNSSKTLWGFRLEDVNPTLQWNARGLVIFAATAMTAGASNTAPVAEAGSHLIVHDTNGSGDEVVTLDGSASSDSDGTILSWVWSEGGEPVASGQTANVTLGLGHHTITLTVTDNDSGTASDDVVVHVNAVPLAVAGDDQWVYDDDYSGSEQVTLDAGDSQDSDGSIVSYVWKEGASQIATGETASVVLALGTHTITLSVTDDDGGTATDALTVRISDNHPPVADAGGDAAMEDADDDGSVTVSLDGTGSSDSDGTIASYVWKDASGATIATGSTASVNLGLGINDITLQVTDNDNDLDLQVVRIWVYPKVDRWVDGATGSNGNPGTAALPWATVDYAVDHCGSGDVIMVREGIYRETVSPAVSGTPSDRCVLMGYPFERVVISGADALVGWTQCTQAIAKDNPAYAHIYYVDIPWQPNRLSQNEIDLTYGRTEGWLFCEGGAATTLIDTTHRTEADDYWIGASCWMWDVSSMTIHYQYEVTDSDQATGTLTVDGTWPTPEAGVDRYYLYNRVELINAEGEWAVEDIGGGTYRVYCWAYGGGDPDSHMMEAARRGAFVISTGTKSYWTYDNLEIRHSLAYAWGTWNSGGDGHNVIQNCSIHHNADTAVYGRYNEYGQYLSNFVAYNGAGISNGACGHVVIAHNEVCFNDIDGLMTTGPRTEATPDAWAEYITVSGNYVHDHNRYNHPDNAQAYRNVRYLTVEDNFIISSVQSYMMEQTDQVVFDNNVIVGASAYMIINGGSSTHTTCRNNTLCYSGYSLVNHAGSGGYYYKNNILVVGRDALMWGNLYPATDYSSDYNLFWHAPDVTGDVVRWDGADLPLSAYSSASGEDANSVYADPRFENAPACFVQLDSDKVHLFTADSVYMASAHTSLFEVGDKVEINWDGVVRTVQSVGADYITFAPGDDYIATEANQVANWKDNSDFILDFSLKAGSPALGADEDGNDMGSDIDIRAYMFGDFNGDGRRDIPIWPVQP